MAKRPTVEVDEKMLISMMAADVPVIGKEDFQPVKEKVADRRDKGEGEQEIPVQKPVNEDCPEAFDREKEVSSKARRKKDIDYESVFLKRFETKFRKQAYVNRDVYDKIFKFVSVIEDVSVSSFINNILHNHLEQYIDVMNEIYIRNTKGLL